MMYINIMLTDYFIIFYHFSVVNAYATVQFSSCANDIWIVSIFNYYISFLFQPQHTSRQGLPYSSLYILSYGKINSLRPTAFTTAYFTAHLDATYWICTSGCTFSFFNRLSKYSSSSLCKTLLRKFRASVLFRML